MAGFILCLFLSDTDWMEVHRCIFVFRSFVSDHHSRTFETFYVTDWINREYNQENQTLLIIKLSLFQFCDLFS